MDSLYLASATRLGHTSATFDAALPDTEVLQIDLPHANLITTQDTCFHTHDQQWAYSVKRIGMRN